MTDPILGSAGIAALLALWIMYRDYRRGQRAKRDLRRYPVRPDNRDALS